MRNSKTIAILLSATMLTACAQDRSFSNMSGAETVGTVAGAIGGGFLGNTIGHGTGRAAATVGGVLLGGLLGNMLGRGMGERDVAYYDDASLHAMNTGQVTTWRNPDTGVYGTITPTRQYHNYAGELCRDYTQDVYLNGQRYTDQGTACLTPSGNWTLIG